MALKQKKNVATTHEKYDEHFSSWKLARDVIAGKKAVHKAGEVYLPKLSGQSPKQYNAYVKRANFYNASWRTIAMLQGLLFRVEPTKELPALVETYALDISMRGVDLDKFASEFAYEKLTIGFVGILVDHPKKVETEGQQITVAQAEALGLRPTLQLYKAESIINWKFKLIANKWTLTMVVLKEAKIVDDGGEFGSDSKDQYRVLDLDENNAYRVRVFEINDKQDDVLVEGPFYPVMNNQPLSTIPFIADFEFAEPPLIDLYDTNIAHYQITADFYHGMHFSALPTLVISGYTSPVLKQGQAEKTFTVGSETAIVLPEPTAKAEFVEFKGAGLTTHKEELKELENRMANLGIRALANEKSGVEAYKTTAARNAGEYSVLANISIETSDMLTKALTLFSTWAGLANQELKYALNREFLPVSLDAPTLTAYLNAWKQGSIELEDLFELFKRADLIAHDKTIEEHKKGLEAEAPSPEEVAAKAKAEMTQQPIAQA